jgi:predicted negative regulator of RcsB-dependent stress response
VQTYQDEKAIDRTAKAAKTAATSLEAIETWARRTFYAGLATAILAGFVALVVGYGAWQYHRVTSAMSEASKQLDASMTRLGQIKFP